MNIQMRNNKLLTQIPGELEWNSKKNPKKEWLKGQKRKTLVTIVGQQTTILTTVQKEKKKFYAIEKVPEKEFPTEDSNSDPKGDDIREHSDDGQDQRAEFLVEYQEESQLEIQDIKLKAGMPQDTANKNLCKHTQDAQTFLVTPTKEMA
ncbi:hypothetical protein O181_025397 [Austropuccinia psidii MF-1]|uniref:Uncharacterized protein n=1 Tax=Austropuccinia psidii MF-1 TaxID=1389203 RepID=A0A9Q3GZU3_9BASI|nr:hypothetical protein [Austropuccinia psidii MF-1]